MPAPCWKLRASQKIAYFCQAIAMPGKPCFIWISGVFKKLIGLAPAFPSWSPPSPWPRSHGQERSWCPGLRGRVKSSPSRWAPVPRRVSTAREVGGTPGLGNATVGIASEGVPGFQSRPEGWEGPHEENAVQPMWALKVNVIA